MKRGRPGKPKCYSFVVNSFLAQLSFQLQQLVFKVFPLVVELLLIHDH